MPGPEKMRVGFFFRSLLPYHVDRLDALARCSCGVEIIAIDLGTGIRLTNSRTVHLILEEAKEHNSRHIFDRVRLIVSAVVRNKISHLFVANYERADVFLASLVLMLLGRWVAVMSDAKFEDKPRKLWRELLKRVAYFPYSASLVSGISTEAYLEFLGFRGQIEHGFDTVSNVRMQSYVDMSGVSGADFRNRHFLFVGRPIWEKNIPFLLDAYASYRKIAQNASRELHICGFNEADERFLALYDRKIPEGVKFHGPSEQVEVAQLMSRSLALLLPSRQETWGLVVNEAVSLNLPVFVSNKIGAKDTLVKSAVNGFILEPDNSDGWAHCMHLIASDEKVWKRFSEASIQFALKGDVDCFVDGVSKLLSLAHHR
jgi:glycosyltransferase involved in cell wall biosynthesis